MNRRESLLTAAGMVSIVWAEPEAQVPIVDTHIHLFDPRRPQGVPWPPKDDRILYRPALPPRYRQVTSGLGIVGAIVVECSPWLEDNRWVLNVAAEDSIIVGTVGNLEPENLDFPKQLEQLHRNPLFRGIRSGNLWGSNLGDKLSNPRVISNLKLLANAGLELDTANPDPALLAAAVRLSDRVPTLRLVIDHLPGLDPPADVSARATLKASLKELGTRPQVYVKISEVVHPIGGQVHYDVAYYQSRLDEIWGIFGVDRVMYGSDWPNSDHSAPFRAEFRVVDQYIATKGKPAAEKFFWKNSFSAYQWVKRASGQPTLNAS